MLKLTSQERRVLLIAQLRANYTISELSELVGESEYSVQRTLSRLRQRQLLRKLPIINVSRLGFSKYEVLFSLTSTAQSNCKDFLAFISGHPQTVFLAEVGGDYQYMIALLAKNLRSLDDYFSEIASKFEGAFAEKIILPVVSSSFFGTGLLAPEVKRDFCIKWKEASEAVSFDETDLKILDGYCNADVKSVSELARKVRISQSTLSKRIKSLEEKEVITGYFYAFDGVDVGMFPFNIFLSFRGITEKREDQLVKLLMKAPEVDMLVRYIGHWDYGILCLVDDAKLITPLLNSIRSLFGDALNSVSVVPQFKTYKWVEWSNFIY